MAVNTTIYYFSGTGNSLKIAEDLSTNMRDSKIVRVAYNTLHITADEDSAKIGFVFPVYFRGLPRMLEGFIKKLKVNSNAYFFAVANFGSSAALSFQQIDGILKEKGARLNANFSVFMPGNMWFMYYPHPEKDFSERIEEEPGRCKIIAGKINCKSENPLPILEKLEEDKKMYNAFIPSTVSNNFWVNEKCTGCAVCSKVCPAKNVYFIDGRPVWKENCEQCLACLHWCPMGAIEYKQDSIGRKRYHNPLIHSRKMFVDSLKKK